MSMRSGRRLFLITAVAGALVAAGVLALPASAAPAPLVSAATGLCLDVDGVRTDDRTPVSTFGCNRQVNQAWEFTGARTLQVYSPAKCLDVQGRGTTPGTLVQIYTCHGEPNQQWRRNADGTIAGVQSGLCLAAPAGAQVRLETCTSPAATRWTGSTGADTVPPSAPAGLRTSDLTCTSVTLSWSAATDDTAVTGYDIYHDGQLMTSVAGLSADLTLVPGVTWGLYVNARDAAGNISQASDSLQLAVPQCQEDDEPPAAPAGLTATASGTTVTLTWRAATDNVGVTGYDVLRDGAKAGAVTGTTFTDSGRAPGTTHRYAVVARDAQGNTSPPSATATATTGAACGSAVCAVTQVGTDNDIPWGLVTLPDGSVLYSRRDAHDIVRLDPATGAKSTAGTVPGVRSTDGEGGLMGLALSPTFGSDRWLYVMHTSAIDNRVVRIRYTTAGILDTASTQVLVSGILRNKYHNGGRLRFGPDGKLYVATGDGQDTRTPQDRTSLNGKVLRIDPDGTVPADNPYGNAVWSLGHRNPQGLAFDSRGRLWEQEFGNSVMDETNLIVRGGNYGWPACEGTSGDCGQAGFVAPEQTYPTSAGSCSGITVVRDALYVACARGARMYRSVISGDALTGQQQFFTGTYGRLRTVEPAPDGGLWLTTTTTGDKDSVPGNSNEKILHVQLGSFS